MKHITIIFISILLLSQPLAKLWVMVDFNIHQAQWAKTLCVQKAQKDNCCQASCQLSKNLKTVDAETEKTPVPQKPKFELLLALIPNTNTYLKAFFSQKIIHQFYFFSPKPSGFIKVWEHPPCSC
jgi:hypothetical protein